MKTTFHVEGMRLKPGNDPAEVDSKKKTTGFKTIRQIQDVILDPMNAPTLTTVCYSRR